MRFGTMLVGAIGMWLGYHMGRGAEGIERRKMERKVRKAQKAFGDLFDGPPNYFE